MYGRSRPASSRPLLSRHPLRLGLYCQDTPVCLGLYCLVYGFIVTEQHQRWRRYAGDRPGVDPPLKALFLCASRPSTRHAEAFLYTHQTHGYGHPSLDLKRPRVRPSENAELPGGKFELGAKPKNGFVFDNEKWSHEVDVKPFKIASARPGDSAREHSGCGLIAHRVPSPS